MMSAPAKRKMSELCEITSSKRIFAADYQLEGVPFFRGKEITEKYNGSLEVSTELFIARQKFEEIKAKFGVPLPGDLLLTSVGTLGSTYVVQSTDEFYFKDGNLTWFRAFDGLDSEYLHYWLSSPQGRAELKKCTIGSSQSAYTIVLLKGMEIALPDISQQQRIASILSAYDDLIENNTRRIAILEEMAQRIYEEWFVRFRFPGHESVRMVESTLGLVPENWEVVSLGEALSALEAGTRPKGGIDPTQKGIPSIGAENIRGLGIYDYRKEKFISREFFNRMNRGQIRSGDVLLYKDGAHIGRKSMFRDGFPHQECAVNEHVFILRPNARLSPAYLFFWLDQEFMTQQIRALNANAAQPGINQQGVNGLPLLIPPPTMVSTFTELIEPFLALLFNLTKKSLTLSEARDLLLPKLISGELDVSKVPVS